jgi:DnaJ-class molecular chaperone
MAEQSRIESRLVETRCARCAGTGRAPCGPWGSDRETCPDCGGVGTVDAVRPARDKDQDRDPSVAQGGTQ